MSYKTSQVQASIRAQKWQRQSQLELQLAIIFVRD